MKFDFFFYFILKKLLQLFLPAVTHRHRGADGPGPFHDASDRGSRRRHGGDATHDHGDRDLPRLVLGLREEQGLAQLKPGTGKRSSSQFIAVAD